MIMEGDIFVVMGAAGRLAAVDCSQPDRTIAV
jgi:hypothetical protein